MSTDETAEDLVEQLAGVVNGWPEPRLLTAILERGNAAVEPLRALLRRVYPVEEEGEDGTFLLTFAVDLLGSLGDASALPELFGLLRRYGDLDIIESVRPAVSRFGPSVIEPALEIARDPSVPVYPRDTAFHIAIEAAGDDLIARSRVAEALREILEGLLARRDEADEDDRELSTWIVNALTDLADPLARELIDAAYQAKMVDRYIIAPEDVEEAYRRGGQTHVEVPRDWLSDYEKQYEDHMAWLRREAEPKPERTYDLPPMTRYEPSPAQPPPPTVETIRKTAPRPGRNDPCWCGSGKKYKKCHLLGDQA